MLKRENKFMKKSISLKVEALKIHREKRGKIEISPKIKVTRKNLKLLYTPGVAEVTREIAKDPKKVINYTNRGNLVAIITDGSRTLGVGDSIPEASLPVMEGKALLLKTLAGVDAVPLCLGTKKKEEIIKTVEILAPNFEVFNLEDIVSPKSLEIREELEKRNFIVFHDDEQGTAIAVLAALFNALKVVGKKLEKIKVCLGGAGNAGYGVFKILVFAGVKNIVVFDKKGIIFRGRKGDNKYQREIAKYSNPENIKGGKREAISGSDVFIGLTGVKNLISGEDIKLMKPYPIIFALSNPEPEIYPKEIEKVTKEYIFASGRSDFKNQINNLLVFPGVLKGLLKAKKKMTLNLQFKIAKAISNLVKNPKRDFIVPSPFDRRLIKTIVDCIVK
jgi:malate dehydrogenase (oxaloacetate-decarboxylating)